LYSFAIKTQNLDPSFQHRPKGTTTIKRRQLRLFLC